MTQPELVWLLLLVLTYLVLTWFNIIFGMLLICCGFFGFVALQLCVDFDVLCYQSVYEKYVPVQLEDFSLTKNYVI